MTVEEFVRLYESEGPFELADSERVALKPADKNRLRVSGNLYRALQAFLSQSQIGQVFEWRPYVLHVFDSELHQTDQIDRARVPDLMFYQTARLKRQQGNLEAGSPITIPPDLAVILVSQEDSYSVVDAKIDRYFQDGVRALWIVDLERKMVTIVGGAFGDLRKKFPFSGKLPGGIKGYTPGGAVIPGFVIEVKAIFE